MYLYPLRIWSLLDLQRCKSSTSVLSAVVRGGALQRRKRNTSCYDFGLLIVEDTWGIWYNHESITK